MIQALRGAFKPKTDLGTLHSPELGEVEKRWLIDCVDSGWVSTAGPFVQKFEGMLSDFTGSKHVVATSNGTAALHACLLLVGVQREHEVLVPPLTFVATANAIAYIGATPHFVDIESESLGIDPDKLEKHLKQTCQLQKGVCIHQSTGRPITALILVHVFGLAAQSHKVAEVCARYNIALIEDCAEALGTKIGTEHVGRVGMLSALSFNGNKIVTAGGGGAILTENATLAATAKHLTTTAKRPHAWEFYHDQVGYNYRLPNLNAALGCAQLSRLPRLLAAKRTLFNTYFDAFSGLECHLLKERSGTTSNYWLQTLLLPKATLEFRNQILNALTAAGIGARPAWTLLHRLPMYTNSPRAELTMAESLEPRIINLPSSARLGDDFT